jgi:hypothetical protein
MAYGFLCNPTAPSVMRYSSSSEDHTYLGYPTGNSWSDVRSTLNATYPYAVNWRDATDLLPPPPSPVPLRPTGVVMTNQPEFVWEEVPGALQYSLEVMHESGSLWSSGRQRVGCSDASGECKYLGPELPGGLYWWRVSAQYVVGIGIYSGPNSPYSEWVEFALPPEAPTPIAPAGTTRFASPTFTWTAVTSAVTYTLRFSVGGDLSVSAEDVGCGSGESTCSLRPEWQFSPGKGYTWMVAAENDYADGPWSDGLVFYTDESLLGDPICCTQPQPLPTSSYPSLYPVLR